MKFAYADPPYHRMGKKLFGPHHEQANIWDDKQTHLDLITRLTEEYPDGWALSCNPRDLTWLLPACPEDRLSRLEELRAEAKQRVEAGLRAIGDGNG